MTQIRFSSEDSLTSTLYKLDEVFCSFPAKGHAHYDFTSPAGKSVIELLNTQQILDQYKFQYDVRADARSIYSNVERQTNWHVNAGTEIEQCRLNAFQVMLTYGEAHYDGWFTIYPEHNLMMHCGNLMPETVINELGVGDQPRDLIVFAYPRIYGKTPSDCYIFKIVEAEAVKRTYKDYRQAMSDTLLKAPSPISKTYPA
ncbi:MAG: hypothetical protein VB070_01695 [Clostridiaceae bacterium]|nr:hypothetical protein [Clostridiaceae bacterium]